MVKSSIYLDIISWNNRFPLDKWWRRKYHIPYLSSEHRKSTFYSQMFEYFEDKMLEEYINSPEKEEKEYIPMSGNWWKGREVPKEEFDDWLKTPL